MLNKKCDELLSRAEGLREFLTTGKVPETAAKIYRRD